MDSQSLHDAQIRVEKTVVEVSLRWITIFAGIFVAWAIWLSTSVVDLRSTVEQNAVIRQNMLLEMEVRLRADSPPQEWKDRIIALQVDMRDIERRLTRLEAHHDREPR